MWSGSREAMKEHRAAPKLKPKLSALTEKQRRKLEKNKNRTADKKRKRWSHLKKVPLEDLDVNVTDYKKYIESKVWRAKRVKFILKVGGKCEECGFVGKLHAHHRHYRTLGKERQEDIKVLCEDCHAPYHGMEKYEYDRPVGK